MAAADAITVRVDSGKGGAAAPAKAKGQLTSKEDRVSGSVRGATLQLWGSLMGSAFMLPLICLLFLLGAVARMVCDWWISQWTDDKFQRTDLFYALVYLGGAFLVALGVFVAGFTYSRASLRASGRLHNRAFRTLLGATMAYFDTTPLGRLLNRFSADMDSIDIKLLDSSETMLQLLSTCVISVVLICVLYPWFLTAVAPLAIFYWVVTSYFRRAIRQLKRIDSISKSPMLSHLQETLLGIATIRAVDKQVEAYESKNNRLITRCAEAYSAFYFGNRWIGFRLDLITTTVVTVTAFLTIVSRGSMSASTAGLAMVYAMQMTGIFQFSTRLISETEAYLTSVERLAHFDRHTPRERTGAAAAAAAPASSKPGPAQPAQPAQSARPPPATWPEAGAISFEGLTVRYRPELQPALRQLGFKVGGGQSVGICGRTGSGKSTLALSLFGVLEAEEGRICIDGVDIASVQLPQLREKLAIIPQDAVLFLGTLRFNLDPFGKHNDEELWSALRRVHMAAFVEGLADGLSTDVAENGSNFSVGQRQLLCFARDLLRGSQVVIMDEATAAVDHETDALIQKTIAESLTGQTLLIIAHRLHTIIQCDRILALEAGRAVQFGRPWDLLQEPGGILSQLADETGEESAVHLRNLAREAAMAAGAAKAEVPTKEADPGSLALAQSAEQDEAEVV